MVLSEEFKTEVLKGDKELIKFYEDLDIEMEEEREKSHVEAYKNTFTFYDEMSIKIDDQDLCFCYFFWAEKNNLEQIHIYFPWTLQAFQHDLN